MMAPDNTERTVSAFRAFVNKAYVLDGGDPLAPVVVGFRHFVARSMPILVGPINEAIPGIVRLAELAEKWWTPHDLLLTAGCSYAEDPYTELIAWALHPNTHPESATHRQDAFLRLFSRIEVSPEKIPVVPQTQVGTSDGVPDMVADHGNFAIVIEAKTRSSEHRTRSGQMQTIAYAGSVATLLSKQTFVGFLTPGREHAPANRQAEHLTYLGVVMALMEALDQHKMSVATESAYKMFFTHMIAHAIPRGFDLPGLLEEVRARSRGRNTQKRMRMLVVEHFAEMSCLYDLLPRSEAHG